MGVYAAGVAVMVTLLFFFDAQCQGRKFVMEGGGMAYVVFKVNDVLYRIASVPIDPKSKRDPEAEQRRQWRAITLLVKAKVVSITEKISTVEREFLSDAVMPSVIMASVGKIALCVGPPAAIFWQCWHQHWRTASGSPSMRTSTAPHAQRPV